jgi:hypothetical protein
MITASRARNWKLSSGRICSSECLIPLAIK